MLSLEELAGVRPIHPTSYLPACLNAAPTLMCGCQARDASLTPTPLTPHCHAGARREMGRSEKLSPPHPLPPHPLPHTATGARREMGRSEKLAIVHPRRFCNAASACAMMLCSGYRFGEAEAVMKQVGRARVPLP